MTVEELAAELGIPAETLAAKPDVVKKWNKSFATTQSEAQAKLDAALQKVQDAKDIERITNESINAAQLTEFNVAQIQANNDALTTANAALTATIESLRKQGFTGLNIPELPKVNTVTPPDPTKSLTDLITKGFTQMGQTMNEVTRYQRVFGTPIPEDPATLADKAAAVRLSVHDYVEQTYKVSAKEQELSAASRQKELDAYAAKKLEEYQAAHPVTTGHPELGPGVPSNYPNIPKPSDAAGVREMAGKSPMEKIRMARDRVSAEIKTRMAAA